MRGVRVSLVAAGLYAMLSASASAQAPAAPAALDQKLRSQIAASIDRGMRWLRFKMEPNGSWVNHPGVTSLVVLAFMESHRKFREDDGPFIRKPLQYIASFAKPDGAIYDRDLPNYNTAVAVLALKASENPQYQSLVEAAQQFLLHSQLDETKGYPPEHAFYGAIGLGSLEANSLPDLDNTGFALASLKMVGVPAAQPVWKKALIFLNRSQNRKESNDQPWAGSDGGFVFRPGFSYAGGTTSYASMTYVGLQSLLYANVEKNDPRVQAALNWIRHNYTFDENRGLGQQALYHYYYFVANALHAYGESVLIDANGIQHNWRQELAQKLLERQHAEWYWVNQSPQWWEGNPTLTTAFALLALERVYNSE